MSDDFNSLLTRIAAVIRQEVPCHPPAADRIADAVIRELGLRRQDSAFTPYDSTEPAAHRYVTDWIVNALSRKPRSAEKLGLVGDGE